MNEIYLWVITVIVAAVGSTTICRIWSDRHRLAKDELLDEDRFFAWRIVLFLVYPTLVAIDLRSTIATAHWFGGGIQQCTYGLFWYKAQPQGLSAEHMLIVLFAGVVVQLALGLSLLPSLFFRPHPFLATIIGYTIATIFTANLLIEPLLAAAGLGGSRWHLALTYTNPEQKVLICSLYVASALTFMLLIRRQRVRLWFADLSRPVVAEKLRDALMQERIDPRSVQVYAKLTLLYEQAGIGGQAKRYLKRLQKLDSRSIYTIFAYAVLQYRLRRYRASREAFLLASDFPHIDPPLKGSLLAAAACSAFAQGDCEGALNLSERALEFDEASLVARMVKVDVFLSTGRKEQAGDEIIAAIRRGLDMDLESKVPLDIDRAFIRLQRMQAANERRGQPALRR